MFVLDHVATPDEVCALGLAAADKIVHANADEASRSTVSLFAYPELQGNRALPTDFRTHPPAGVGKAFTTPGSTSQAFVPGSNVSDQVTRSIVVTSAR
jgi:hypothetical protein